MSLFQKHLVGIDSWRVTGSDFLFAGIFLLGISTTYLILRWRGRIPFHSSERKPFVQVEQRTDRAISEIGYHRLADETITGYSQCILLNSQLDDVGEPPLLIGDAPVTWGKAREQVTVWVDDEALDNIHCKIWLGEYGSHYLSDNGTSLGTWLNYEEVAPEGKALAAR